LVIEQLPIVSYQLPVTEKMSAYRSLLFVLTLLMTTAMHAQPTAKELEEVFNKELIDAGVVGGSLVLIKNGKLEVETHYGFANLEKQQRVSADTICHWASNTKPFTGIAIMQLRDRGLIKLEDPVTKYVPELRKIHNPFGSMDAITVRHLLTPSGGFPNG